MTMLSPADLTNPVVVTSVSHTEPDISIRVGPEDGRLDFVIRTQERTGMRMNDAGQVSGVVDDARVMAMLAVSDFLLQELDENTLRGVLPGRMQEVADASAAIDWTEWEFTRIEVDGVGYALRVRQMDPGFVAIADLGRFAVTMRGRELPTDRRFTLTRPEPERGHRT